jgi:hypothetical protein
MTVDACAKLDGVRGRLRRVVVSAERIRAMLGD